MQNVFNSGPACVVCDVKNMTSPPRPLDKIEICALYARLHFEKKINIMISALDLYIQSREHLQVLLRDNQQGISLKIQQKLTTGGKGQRICDQGNLEKIVLALQTYCTLRFK